MQLNKLSKPKLLIFAALFAFVGVFAIYYSFAAVSSIATLEAEHMIAPRSTKITSISSASGGQALRFSTATSASGSVATASNSTKIEVRAKAVYCAGDWPKVGVSIDGRTAVPVTYVKTMDWSTLSGNIALNPGTAQRSPRNATLTYWQGLCPLPVR